MAKTHVKNKLVAFLHDELNEETAFNVATHLSQCEECRAEFEELKFGDELVKSLASDSPSETIWLNIRENLTESSLIKPKRSTRAQLFKSNGLRLVSTMFTFIAVITGAWFYEFKSEQPVIFNFDEYLTMLESQPIKDFPQPFAAMPKKFGKVDSVTAHRAIGLKEVGIAMDSLGYNLYANRLRQTQAGFAAQFIYGNDNEVLAVFVLPQKMKSKFGERSIESIEIGSFSSAKVVSKTVSTLWLKNERCGFVFVSFNMSEPALQDVAQLFVE